MVLDHVLERSLVIHAERATVFRFFADSERFARWWGAGSTIDPRVGGRLAIRHPNGVVVSGEVTDLVDGERIAFTYGYESGQPIGPGESLVTITLEDVADGTRLDLRHAFHEAGVRDAHLAGWRYHLAVFAKVVSDEQFAGAEHIIDGWFAAWNADEEDDRRRALESVASASIEFRDPFGVTSGVEDLLGHIRQARLHLKTFALGREGAVRRSHGLALAAFAARDGEGKQVMQGENLYELAPDGKLARVIGLPA